jgi:hypothetical protein
MRQPSQLIRPILGRLYQMGRGILLTLFSHRSYERSRSHVWNSQLYSAALSPVAYRTDCGVTPTPEAGRMTNFRWKTRHTTQLPDASEALARIPFARIYAPRTVW